MVGLRFSPFRPFEGELSWSTVRWRPLVVRTVKGECAGFHFVNGECRGVSLGERRVVSCVFVKVFSLLGQWVRGEKKGGLVLNVWAVVLFF